MIYKTIFLSALLVPTIIAHNNAGLVEIQKLKSEQAQKEMELSRIGAEIEEKEALIDLMMAKVRETAARVFESLNEQEQKEFHQELNAFMVRTNKALAVPDVKNFLMTEFFNDMGKHSDEIERIKSLLIRKIIEREILKRLVKRYEENLQIAAQMDLDLAELEASASV
ncbi:hypothetical protein HYX58_01905 [Candidatus Dependentiae bacterium]|nr:hypothetical protein [Candidatus Dependentiae bacterium]